MISGSYLRVAKAVHVEGERDAKRLVERVRRCGGHNVTGIDAEHIHLETGTESEVFAVALCFAFMMIAGAEGELVVVGVFGTYTPLNFFEFAFETAFAVVETLEHTRNGRNVVVVFTDALLIVLIVFVVLTQRTRGNEEFVGVGRDRKTVGTR